MFEYGNVTRMLREQGITLAALADELGVKPATISNVTAGRSKSYPVQVAIAEKLKTTVEALWPGQVRLRRNRAEISRKVVSAAKQRTL